MQCNCLKYNYLIFRTPLNRFYSNKCGIKTSGAKEIILNFVHCKYLGFYISMVL